MTLLRPRKHIPDILDTLAQLSNDEVPVRPRVAREMLDLLPPEVWSDPTLRWLDPGLKSGALLREAAQRLLIGLADWEPDFEKRREHIFRNMLFGLPITQITALVGRRSLYYTRDASSDLSVVQFDSAEGNLPLVLSQHQFNKKGRCRCGAGRDLDRGSRREAHAYAFIHEQFPPKEMEDMKFDVIVSNPPFQLEDGGYSASATPIYHHFVERAIAMKPRYVVMITPSRWFAGGKGLDKYRERMLNDHRIRSLVDYPKLYDAFPGVKIRGGVSYFLWDREYNGPCTIQTVEGGMPVGPAVTRRLDAYDVLVRRNEAVSILEKVLAKGERKLSDRVSSAKPFGLRTFFHGAKTVAGLKDPVTLYGSQRVSYVERSKIPQNADWINDWKVLVSAVQGTSSAVETQFLGRPIVAGKDAACTETYLVAGRFNNRIEAERYSAYLRTRFVRFLVSLRKSTQHATKSVYRFVPDIPLDKGWTDADLYERYGLTSEEVAFIESQVREMPDELEGLDQE